MNNIKKAARTEVAHGKRDNLTDNHTLDASQSIYGLRITHETDEG